jgi:hypothetical protein
MGRSTVLCLPPKLVLPAIKVSLTLICLFACLLFYPHLFMCEYVCVSVCLSVGISVSLPLPLPMSFCVGQIFELVKLMFF